jgi:hypothetical protein
MEKKDNELYFNQHWQKLVFNSVLLGFALVFIFFFLVPVYFDHVKNIFSFPTPTQIVPALSPIGFDAKWSVNNARAHYGLPAAPADGSYTDLLPYTPYTLALFGLLSGFSNHTAYVIVTLITLTVYFCAIKFFPIQQQTTHSTALALKMLIGITGLFSFGMLFELERGQFNVISGVLCIAAVYMYHYTQKKWLTLIAICMLVTGSQMKIHFLPFFAFLLLGDRNWRIKIFWAILAAVIYIALLLLWGVDGFYKYLNEAYTVNTTLFGKFSAAVYHSASNFVYLTFPTKPDSTQRIIIILFSLWFTVCSLASWFFIRKLPISQQLPSLILLCVIFCCTTFTNQSSDYRLPVITIAFLGFVLNYQLPISTSSHAVKGKNSVALLTLATASVVHALILVPPTLRGYYFVRYSISAPWSYMLNALENAFPSLFIFAGCVLLLSMLNFISGYKASLKS